MRWSLLLATAAVFAPLGVANAQYGYYDGGWGPPGYFASTPIEGAANGLSNMMRSAGVANLLDSQAEVYQQQAQSAALDNDVKYAQAYFTRKQTRDAYMADKRNNRARTTEAAFRQAPAQPQRLTSNELDPVSGELYWPVGLSGDRYAPIEEQIGKIFAARAQSPASYGAQQSKQVQALINDLRKLLNAHVSEIPNQQWTDAEGFLRRLTQEARYANS